MSGRQDREKRREERLRQETEVAAEDRRRRMLQLGAGAAFLVVAVVLVLIVVQSSGSGGDANLEDVATVNRELAGIPQHELVLGEAKAPVELVEFGDLKCPICKGFSEDVLPAVIQSQVRTGKAKIAFRNFTIIDEESVPAGAAAIAAGAQGRGWNFVDVFYRNQGNEQSHYVDDEFLTAVARAAGVKDIARWNRVRRSAKTIAEVEATTAEAHELGFTGTPSFAVRAAGARSLETLGTPGSSGEIEEAIEGAS